ncbi:hypothetical protein D9758_006279 [Tetrapyrgos nigripes]|uniref:Uncharacterized protein n=1 Tax=Tetrapyrgos nigripes TaxID=182062 RepID=A0A8H5DA28_9AGAR|nr:hypothetical protein D9758_006279 [Tetrapyrgos nigripes]
MRFFLGEAIAVCRAISLFSETGATTTRIPVSQWKAQTITLNREADGGYGDAPTIFDVIDTSNLCDHVGLLNVLIASIPPSPVIIAFLPVSCTRNRCCSAEKTLRRSSLNDFMETLRRIGLTYRSMPYRLRLGLQLSL